MTETVQMRDNSKRKSADRLSSIVDRVSPANPATSTTIKKTVLVAKRGVGVGSRGGKRS